MDCKKARLSAIVHMVREQSVPKGYKEINFNYEDLAITLVKVDAFNWVCVYEREVAETEFYKFYRITRVKRVIPMSSPEITDDFFDYIEAVVLIEGEEIIREIR